ncbi:MAG: glycosyltransferase family 1 protein [Planctomycetota bacterium]|nr:MAG: glycosyltransferase family 1 protein [Planctomycetota bacterium]
MHLLQVCNVGEITGGTGACAWSVTRALPEMRHTIAFLSRIAPATSTAFAGHTLREWGSLDEARDQNLGADLVLLHNMGPGRRGSLGPRDLWTGPTIQYVHSAGARAAADRTVYCSRWLAETCGNVDGEVLWQGVPQPVPPREGGRDVGGRLRVGRICTPIARKWPDALLPFYAVLAQRHPQVQWEFVGCPLAMQPMLQNACRGQAVFHRAGWSARSLFWNWDALLYHHPTLTESFGRTVAEAARAGCMPLVDARGGFLEQLEVLPGVGCRTLDEFSRALEELPNRRRSPGFVADICAAADQHFSMTAFRKRLWQVIESTPRA